ncbi:MAG: hypothetical protein BME93_02070 [Methanosarcinales archaeon Met12]|nr:MAG: hypothetical protein BME93_02070 [Methanosarcinales archaeon Met12]
MKFHKAKKVVIVTEASILDDVIEMMTELGVDGYTVQSATGKGERGVRSGNSFSGLFKNVRIDTITSEEVAKKIAVEMMERFFKNYAGIVYMLDVEIIRAKKFHVPE